MVCAASQSRSRFCSLLGSSSGLLSVEGEVHSEAAEQGMCQAFRPLRVWLVSPDTSGKQFTALHGCLSVDEDQD